MLSDTGRTAKGAASSFRSANHRLAVVADRSLNERIRQLLRFYGLRTSLIRFKVLSALVCAAVDGRVVGARGVHAQLTSMTFISVREVLKRLCDEGVILLQADKSYRITDEAWSRLTQHLDEDAMESL